MTVINVKGMGQYFTPRSVADFMVSLIRKEKSTLILEPSAGKGIFLDVLWKRGFRNLVAFEIDPSLNNESPVDIIYGDFLAAPIEESPEVIIGNPPYVRWKNLPKKDRERFRKDPKWKDVINGLSDLSYAFLHKCIDILKPGGELIFITPYFWTETLHSSDIRRKMARNGELREVVNFHEMRIFKAVSLSIIIFRFVKAHSGSPVRVVQLRSKSNLTPDCLVRLDNVLRRLYATEKYIREDIIEAYLHTQFKGGMPWKFLPPAVEQRLESIEKACMTCAPVVRTANGKRISLGRLYEEEDVEHLGISKETLMRTKFRGRTYWTVKDAPRSLEDFFQKDEGLIRSSHARHPSMRYVRLGDIAEIGNGMVSGLDKAFRLPEGLQLSPREKNITFSVVKANSLHQYYHDGATSYAFPNSVSSEDEFCREYPNIYGHLAKFRKDLSKRYDYRRFIPWWHWVFLRNKSLLEQNSKKIFVPCKDRFDNRGYVRFAYIEGSLVATQDVTAIVKSEQFREDERYIVAVLNSSLTFEWLKHKGLTRGGVLEFSEKPLTRIPIRLIDWMNDDEVTIHNSIVELVDKILASQGREPYSSKIEEALQMLYNVNHS